MASTVDERGAQPTPHERVYPRLTLTEFEVIETFSGFYDEGDPELPAEPRHDVSINAKCEELPSYRGEKVLKTFWPLPMEIAIRSTSDRAFAQKGRRSLRTIYLIEDIFMPLLRAIRHGDIEAAELQVSVEIDSSGLATNPVFGSLHIRRKSVRMRAVKWHQGDLQFAIACILGLPFLVGITWGLYFGSELLARFITDSAIDQSVMAMLATVVVAVGFIRLLWGRSHNLI